MRRPKVDSHTFAGMEDAVSLQDHAAAVYSGEELAARMRELGANISGKAGEMERKSPLFYGTGDNPSLF